MPRPLALATAAALAAALIASAAVSGQAPPPKAAAVAAARRRSDGRPRRRRARLRARDREGRHPGRLPRLVRARRHRLPPGARQRLGSDQRAAGAAQSDRGAAGMGAARRRRRGQRRAGLADGAVDVHRPGRLEALRQLPVGLVAPAPKAGACSSTSARDAPTPVAFAPGFVRMPAAAGRYVAPASPGAGAPADPVLPLMQAEKAANTDAGFLRAFADEARYHRPGSLPLIGRAAIEGDPAVRASVENEARIAGRGAGTFGGHRLQLRPLRDAAWRRGATPGPRLRRRQAITSASGGGTPRETGRSSLTSTSPMADDWVRPDSTGYI